MTIFLNRSTNKPTTLKTQEKRTFWNPIRRVETTPYVLYIVDRLFNDVTEYRLLSNYIEYGEPLGFIPPKTTQTTLHKVHEPKFKPSPYKDLLTTDYRPSSIYNVNTDEYKL